MDAFSYIGGSSKRLRGKHQARIVDYGDVNFDEGIFRHGTAREEVLLAAGLNIEEINTLFEEQDRLKSQFLQNLWEPGWWTVSPNAESNDRWWLERVPRAEQMLATITLGPLAERIRKLPSRAGCRFRATIHHTLHYKRGLADLFCYQQLSPYFGTADFDEARGRPNRLEGKVGRVFLTCPENNKSGLVGKTIQLGTAIFAQLPSGNDRQHTLLEDWISLWSRLIPNDHAVDGGPRFRSMDPKQVTTVVTVPVIAKAGESHFVVRYVIYVDVEHAENGKRPVSDELLPIVWEAAAGIVESVGHLRQARADDEPIFSLSSAVRDEQFIKTSCMSNGDQSKVEDIEWPEQRNFPDLVFLDFPDRETKYLLTPDELDLRSAF